MNGIHLLTASFEDKSTNYGKIDLFSIIDNSFNKVLTLEVGRNLISVRWDPSGRFFLVEVKDYFSVYDCLGNLIKEYKSNKFERVKYNIIKAFWRPRHIPILDQSSLNDKILKDMKNVTKKFEEIDIQFLSEIEQQNYQKKKQIKENFLKIINSRKAHWNSLNEERIKIKSSTVSKIVEAEYWREEVLSTKEEFVKDTERF